MPFFHSVPVKQAALLLMFGLSGLMLFSPFSQAQLNEEMPPFLPEPPPLQKSLFWLLESRPASRFSLSSAAETTKEDLLLNDLYSENGIQAYWVTEKGAKAKARLLYQALNRAEEEGLDPTRYQTQKIAALLKAQDVDSLARLDILLTLAMSRYLHDLRLGRAVSAKLPRSQFAAARSKKEDLFQLLLEGLNQPDPAVFLAGQAPQHREYRALKELLGVYRRLEAANAWPYIPDGPILRPGMTDKRLVRLAWRLHLSGDLPTLPPQFYTKESAATAIKEQPLVYDKQLVKAVKRLQHRCHLQQDGLVGKKTLAALNKPVQTQIKKILLNMERWRWLPDNLAGRRILVNIAGFDLNLLHNGRSELTMPVIVGETKYKTPVFSHAMSYIEINPYWNIPPSIASEEIVEKMQNDPEYLKKKRIRIFDGWDRDAPEIPPEAVDWHSVGADIRKYRLRQEPGRNNALGTIKFMFPNHSNIYLHDTPGQSLFRRARRAFSHGCIRVSRPLDLASQLLQADGQPRSKKRLQQQINSGKQAVLVLKQPVPVHIVYLTVRITADGIPQFYEDVYGRDALLAEGLFAADKNRPHAAMTHSF